MLGGGLVQIISHSFIQYILDTDINMVCKENGQFDAMYLLLYYYYGGCIYSALKKFDRALFFFEVSSGGGMSCTPGI